MTDRKDEPIGLDGPLDLSDEQVRRIEAVPSVRDLEEADAGRGTPPAELEARALDEAVQGDG
jgi:hypothetical protein